MKIKRLLTITLLVGIAAGLLMGGCNGSGSPPQPKPPTNTPQNIQPATHPDLAISAIEVFPSQPQAGQRFALNVYVTNQGNAPSGDYDVAIFIRDVSRSSTYPVGTFRQPGLQPGENVVAYTSTDRLVNDPGSFQVHVEIKPFLFQDGNTQNNTLIWAFTVK